MKNFYFAISVFCALLISSFSSAQDNLSMGPQYINDVYYSFENGTVGTSPRDTWELAFFTPRFSAGIIINEGYGVKVYTYPDGDTAAWSTVDTVGMTSWTPLFNSPTVWEDGAFNRNALGHPDYGWGIYNMVTHNLTGDSLYVVEIPGVGFKKLWIVEKLSIDNVYKFRYANLDGSELQDITLDIIPFESKRFIYFSMVTNQTVDREPDAESYDIQFTRYMEIVYDNENNPSPYLVTGVANNVDIASNRFHPVGPNFNNWMSKPLDSLKNAIGYDWKIFDMGTFSWEIVDSNYYFVKNYSGDIYKLEFLSWAGSGTGDLSLNSSLVSLSSVEGNVTDSKYFEIYPNPAVNQFTVKAEIDADDADLILYDQAGRKLFQTRVSGIELSSGFSIVDTGLSKGLYIVNLTSEKSSISRKLFIK